LKIRAKGHRDLVREIELRPAEILVGEHALSLSERLHDLEIRLHSDSGVFDARASIAATSLGDSRRLFVGRTPAWGERDGARIATQVLRDLPAGDYEVALLFSDANVLWRDLPRRVEVPGGPVDIWCTDQGEPCHLALRIVEAETGAPIRGLDAHAGRPVLLDLGGQTGYLPVEESGLFVWRSVRPWRAARWRIEIPGREPRRGNWESAALEDDLLVLEVRLPARARR